MFSLLDNVRVECFGGVSGNLTVPMCSAELTDHIYGFNFAVAPILKELGQNMCF